MKEIVRATTLGGLLFLLPLVLVLYFLGSAVGTLTEFAQPIADRFGVHRFWVWVFAPLILVLVSFAAGLVARTEVGGRMTAWAESSFLGEIPQYQLLKSMAEGHARVESTSESTSGVRAALVSIEGGWQICYLLEALEQGWAAVFLPQAPTATVGSVMYVAADRVRPLGITMERAMEIVKHGGIGSGEALRGAELGPRPGQATT